MRLILSLLVMMSFSLLFAGTKDVPSTIQEVKVFRSGAQVIRSAAVNIPAGTTTLIFSGLPQEVNPSSIQVKGVGNFTIQSVKHQLNYLQQTPDKAAVQALEDKIQALDVEMEDLQVMQSVYQSEINFLNANQRIGGNDNGTNVTALKEATTYYRDRMTSLQQSTLSGNRRIREIQQEKSRLVNQLNELRTTSSTTTSEVVVEVKAAAPVQGRFSIEYVVATAGWQPAYDIRVSDITSPVALTYKASVFQSTGEDWDKVQLTLSSGNPSEGGVMPTLYPWYLRPGVRPMAYQQSYQGAYNSGVREIRGMVRDMSTGEPLPYANVTVLDAYGNLVNGTNTNYDGFYALAVPTGGVNVRYSMVGYDAYTTPVYSSSINVNLSSSAVVLQEVAIVSKAIRYQEPGAMEDMGAATTVANTVAYRATTFEFEVEEPYSVPSDGKNYTVGMNELDLPAEYTYYCTPKLDLDAFLFAKVTGWEDKNLLDGPANLYFEGTYIGETFLNLQQTTDTLDLSLGRDKSIVVTRKRREAFSKRQLIGGKQTQLISWELSVRNNKSQPINLSVYDQIPVSQQQDIEVTLEEAADVIVQDLQGLLTWQKTLEPRGSDTWHFTYSVKYPKDMRLYLE